jgi:hypothetical protein
MIRCTAVSFVTAFGLALSASAPAASMFSGLEVGASSQSIGPGGGTDDPGTLTGSAPLSITASTAASSAAAAADFGTNSARASVPEVSEPFSSAGARAHSVWRDVWTITGGTGSGLASLTVHLDGSQAVAGGTGAFSYVLSIASDPGSAGGHVARADGGKETWNDDLGGTFEFTYGAPLYVESRLEVAGSAGEGGSAELDFGSTAVLTLLELPDGATVSTASGTTPPVEGDDPAEAAAGDEAGAAAVPAPAAASLLVASLALALRARRGARAAPSAR